MKYLVTRDVNGTPIHIAPYYVSTPSVETPLHPNVSLQRRLMLRSADGWTYSVMDIG